LQLTSAKTEVKTKRARSVADILVKGKLDLILAVLGVQFEGEIEVAFEVVYLRLFRHTVIKR